MIYLILGDVIRGPPGCLVSLLCEVAGVKKIVPSFYNNYAHCLHKNLHYFSFISRSPCLLITCSYLALSDGNLAVGSDMMVVSPLFPCLGIRLCKVL